MVGIVQILKYSQSAINQLISIQLFGGQIRSTEVILESKYLASSWTCSGDRFVFTVVCPSGTCFVEITTFWLGSDFSFTFTTSNRTSPLDHFISVTNRFECLTLWQDIVTSWFLTFWIASLRAKIKKVGMILKVYI